MPIFDLYSKRQRRSERAGKPDIYTYGNLPEKLKVQIVHIWIDAIGKWEPYGGASNDAWIFIHDALAREKGLFQLAVRGNASERTIDWFMGTADGDNVLDAIELTFQVIANYGENLRIEGSDVKVSPDDAMKELNARFREHSIGYQFEGKQLIRVDSQFIHSEIVKDALSLLSEPIFKKANEEFQLAHKRYREGSSKDCVVAAQRCFESALKAICEFKEWPYQAGDRASELIKVVRQHGLFPDYLGPGFDSYVSVMRTGLPNVRNNAGGHGDGPNAPDIPEYIAAYALHLTASNVVLLANALKPVRT